MDDYKLCYTINVPVTSILFMEFSTNGRFLAVAEEGHRIIYVLEESKGFYPTFSAKLSANPTSLVWESSAKFYVGLSDGRFVDYRVDLINQRLAKGTTNSYLYGGFPATAIAIDAKSTTLALSVGPDVFAFRRINRTDEFHFIANISSRLNFERSPGSPAPPFPRSLSFVPDTARLVIAFCQQNLATIALTFDEDSNLHASFQMGKIDYSGFPLLRAISSESGQKFDGFSRFWIHGNSYQDDGDSFPFLFINGGARTLSGSTNGSAVIRDTVTQRQIQLLEHNGDPSQSTMIANSLLMPTSGERRAKISRIAYHVSEREYRITTAASGLNTAVKIWAAPNHTPSMRTRNYRKPWRYVAYIGVITIFITIVAFSNVKPPNEEEFIRFIAKIIITITKGRDWITSSVADSVSYAVETIDRWFEDLELALHEMSGEPTANSRF